MVGKINQTNPFAGLNNSRVSQDVLKQQQIDSKEHINGNMPKKDKNKLEREDFFKLIIAEIQNQSPLNPKEGAEFLEGLVNFGQYDELNSLNKSLKPMNDSIKSSNVLLATNLIGKTVQAKNPTTMLHQGTIADGKINAGIDIPHSCADVKFSVLDSAGNEVHSYSLGMQKPGFYNHTWDGTNARGEKVPPGTYTFKAITEVQGEEKELDIYTRTNVQGVTLPRMPGELVTLQLEGNSKIKLDDVREVFEN